MEKKVKKISYALMQWVIVAILSYSIITGQYISNAAGILFSFLFIILFIKQES